MKKVIYVGAGIAAVNVVNAGCCSNNVKLTDIKIDGAENVAEEFKNNFDTISKSLNGFKFEKADISTNLVVFLPKEGDGGYLVIVTKELYKKQEDSVKKKCSKFANTQYYFCLLSNEYKIEDIPEGVKFEVDKNDKNLFKAVK